MGYHLTTSLNLDYGDRIMGNLLQESIKSSLFNFYPFSKILKKYTGMRTPQYYKATFSKLKKEWEQKAAEIELTKARNINNEIKKTFTNYNHPNYLNSQTIIAERPVLMKFLHSTSYNQMDQKSVSQALDFIPNLMPI